MKIRIKYFDGAVKLNKISKGNWIDVYANKDVFIPCGQSAMIPLGFALELPEGWEGHLAPRSSTFKTWGIVQTNSVGVVDDSYIGDNDQWHMPVYCLQGKDFSLEDDELQRTLEYWFKGDEYDLNVQPNGDLMYTSKVGTLYMKHNPLIVKAGTWIRKGDKIGQFRIMEVMPDIQFDEVESFGNADRGGFGTTGTN